MDPLVPVTVTVNVPERLLGTFTVKLELPGAVTLVGLRLVVGPDRDTDAVSETVLWKPARALTIIVEVPDDPAGMFR